MSEQPVAFAVTQNASFTAHPVTPKASLFTVLVVDLLALAIAFFGSQVSDDEGIAGVIVMMVMIGALAGHVLVGHLRGALVHDVIERRHSKMSPNGDILVPNVAPRLAELQNVSERRHCGNVNDRRHSC